MDAKVRTPSLMDEYPLLVYPSLAEAMGINKAVVFQQLHFLLNAQKTSKNTYVFIEGRWWVYNTYEEWKETYFSWLGIRTLKGIFLELQNDGLILFMQSVKNKSDRRKWYTIDYEAWDKYKLTIGQNLHDGSWGKNGTMDSAKNARSNGQKISDGYSGISSETSTENVPRKRVERPRDLFYDAIAKEFNLTASGQIVCIRGMMQGNAKRGTWKDCNFDPPVTDAQEITDFGSYMRKTIADINRENEKKGNPTRIKEISAAVTIQRWFYDFRAARDAIHPVQPVTPTEAEMKMRSPIHKTNEDFKRFEEELKAQGEPTT